MASETSGEKKPVNKPGTYKHAESGQVLHCTDSIQADAVVRQGFKRVGELPTRSNTKTEDKKGDDAKK